MVEATLRSARDLLHEIWDVERDADTPAAAKVLGRIADRLSNTGTVLIYAMLVAYGVSLLYKAWPQQLHENAAALANKWWAWVLIVLIIVSALRFGLQITKAFKRWNVASLVGSLLVFDLLLKQAPPLFGFAGFSPVDYLFGNFGEWGLGEMLRTVFGL
jgi:hypothetical protein